MPARLLPYLPVLFSLLGLGFLFLTILWLRSRAERQRKRPPFTRNLLRSPGESLRRQVDDVHFDLLGLLLATAFAPVFLGSMLALQLASGARVVSLVFVALLVGIPGYLAVKAKRLFERRNALQLGWEGELAVGEELNQLMLKGYRVYHDFPAEVFNIDHVVIGTRGVYAVETKTRSKAPRGAGSGAAKVTFDGKSLRFPDHVETAAIEQADRQATWLAKWLRQSVGEVVPVMPVLVLPGWFVELSAKPKRVFVLGSGSIQKHFPTLGNAHLTPQQVQQVAYQVEQRCRTVEPWTPAKMRQAPKASGA